MEQYMWIVWLAVFVISLIIEAAGTDLVSIFFAVGSLVALIMSFIPEVAWWVELIAFLVISILLLAALRPLAKKYLKKDIVRSNVDELVHQKSVLNKAIAPNEKGELTLNGMDWTAIGQDENASIPVGAKVEILAVSGNKLIVRALDDK